MYAFIRIFKWLECGVIKDQIGFEEERRNRFKDIDEKEKAAQIDDYLGEVWWINEEVWPELKEVVMERTKECLDYVEAITIDCEGGGQTIQMSLLSEVGIVTLIWCGCGRRIHGNSREQKASNSHRQQG